MSLKTALSVIDKIAAVKSTKKKVEMLQEDKYFLQEIVNLALNINIKFGIKKFPIDDGKLVFSGKSDPEKLLGYLKKLSASRGTKDSEVRKLASLCSCPEEIELVRRIVNKDLRCGISLKLAAQVYPDLPTKDVMLCAKAARIVIKNTTRIIDDNISSFVKSCGGWANVGVSVKEDGVRCKISLLEDGNVEYMSRNGLPYNNFHKFDSVCRKMIEALRLAGHKSAQLDGEVVSSDDDFQKQMTQTRRIENVKDDIFVLKLFDIPGLPKTNQKGREELLQKIYDSALTERDKRLVKLVLSAKVKNNDAFLRLYDNITVQQKKEGVVLKDMGALYEPKRSNSWMKVKTFYSVDLIVLKAIKGKKGTKVENVLGALVVDFKGNKVKIGSGYSDEERVEFLENPPHMIEVEYKSITKDGSLFHASFIRVREDK